MSKKRAIITSDEFNRVPCIFKGTTGDEGTAGISTEIVALNFLSGIPGIPKLLKTPFEWEGAKGFVREFFEGEAALRLTEFSGDSRLVIQFAYAVMHILEKIHKKGLIHGDISPLNIIVESKCPMKVSIIDFEFAQIIGKAFIPPENIAFAIPEGTYRAAPFVDLYALVASLSILICVDKLNDQTVPVGKKQMTPQYFIQFLPEDWRSFLRPLLENHAHPSLRSVETLATAFSTFTPD